MFVGVIGLFLMAMALLQACNTNKEECGPSPCGACDEGCAASDECIDGEWMCTCMCETDFHMCTEDADCLSGTCVEVPAVEGAARACANEPDVWTHTCETPGEGECCDDADCTDGPLGEGTCAAIEMDYCGGIEPPPENTCHYQQCTTDADCGAEQACLPQGVHGTLTNTCISASCQQHGDCTAGDGGFCSLLYSGNTCPGLALACTYDDSECRRADGCENWSLCVPTENGASCQEEQELP
jgi:hypothetical protein